MAKAKIQKPRGEKNRLPRSFVTLLLDRSGSMSGIKGQTIEGFNTFLTGLQKEKKADIRFTFLQFDSESLDKCAVAEPVGKVPLLTDATFQPRGGTPLIDAAYKTIKAVEEAVAKEDIKPRVVIAIQTDGEENQSREHTWADLSTLVKAKQEAGWQFNFLGAGIDAYQQAAQMNISVANTLSYGNSMAETASAFGGLASNSASYSSARSVNNSFSSFQKQSSGDKFDPGITSVTGKTS